MCCRTASRRAHRRADEELLSRLRVPLSTLRPRPHERRRMTRGHRGSLLLRCRALSSPSHAGVSRRTQPDPPALDPPQPGNPITYDTACSTPRRPAHLTTAPAVVGAVLACVVPVLKEHAVTKGIYELEWPEERAERLGSWLRVLLEAGGRQRKALLAEFEEFHPRGGLARGIVPPLG